MQMNLENIRIHYKLYNSPKNNTDYLVLIHGLGLDLTMWEPLIPHLQEYCHIVTFDVRGHGETQGQANPITWDILLDDFHSLIQSLDISTFHLAGYGFGGNLAIKINEVYPEKVKSLILTSVYMYFPKNVAIKELEKRNQLISHGKMSDLAKNMIRQICYIPTPENELLLTKAYDKVEQRTYFNMFQMLTETVTSEDLKEIDKEVLLIQGDKDPLFPIQQTNLYQSHLQKSFSYVVPNSSNLVPLDSPEIYVKLVGHFIQEGISNKFISVMEQVFTEDFTTILKQTFDTLEIAIINGFKVNFKGDEIKGKWNQRKAKNLLAYLAFHNPSSREDLINEFWGESDLVSAKNNLRVAINHLKRILQKHHLDSFLKIGREDIRLVGSISFDLTNYLQLLDKCEVERDPSLKRVLFKELEDTYQERMFLDIYDDWLLTIQQQIESKLHKISETME
ncbi:alpha/beta fold hydrolase [Ornithinibacillus xuwenensis]|uniref:Alpha/beta fold hydrolase n=1 Tax=Ornithinibacillus xuwenensis TaxID=3144668 RepID=A0ABU9XIS6_9BACI